MTSRQQRRDFLKQSAMLGLGAFISGGVPLFAKERSPNEKLRIACIGVGGKGESDTDHAGIVGDIVALCDIDDNHLDEKAAKFPSAKKYHDFRKLLEEMENSIDAVTVSTPDHTHAPAAMMAMRMGKHVYCQKPLTHSVYEARELRKAAAKYKVVTQMGNQGTALPGLRSAVEAVQAGAIGPVREVHVWTNRPGTYWRQAPQYTARPTETPAIPKTVHWDLFLGPAPERPYHPWYHPFGWRGWRDFGTGALGDMACHTANMAFLALKLAAPTTVSAVHAPLNPETFQEWATITYEFPARGELAPCKLVWWEGIKDGKRNLPASELVQGNKFSDSGLVLVGDKGILFSPNDYGASFSLLPEKDFASYKAPPERLPRRPTTDPKPNNDLEMKREWVEGIKGGPAPMSNFDYAAQLTETMLLGNIAIRVGKKIEWDAERLQVTNAPEAAQYIQREYRKGWSL